MVRSWDYKDGTGFGPLKNEQSERRIAIDVDVSMNLENSLKGYLNILTI